MISFNCPSCKTLMTREDREAGQKFPCPSCGQRLQVPSAQGAYAPRSEAVNPQGPGPLPPIPAAAPPAAFPPAPKGTASLLAHFRVIPHRQKLLIGAGALVLLVLFIVFIGKLLFSSSGTTGAREPNESVNRAIGTQEEAQSLLKKALDSWSFGDLIPDFRRKHPDVTVEDPDWVAGHVLLKYEITGTRKVENGNFEFSVILIFQSKGRTELREARRFDVRKTGEKWSIDGRKI